MERWASVKENCEELKRERAFQTTPPRRVVFDLQGLPDSEEEVATA
jgi:hypothetical protein